MCGQTTGATPLHIASENGHVEAVRALVELGAAVNQAEVGLLDMSLGLVVRTYLTVCGLCVWVLLWVAGMRGCMVCGVRQGR